jgi:hypothetical protein
LLWSRQKKFNYDFVSVNFILFPQIFQRIGITLSKWIKHLRVTLQSK